MGIKHFAAGLPVDLADVCVTNLEGVLLGNLVNDLLHSLFLTMGKPKRDGKA